MFFHHQNWPKPWHAPAWVFGVNVTENQNVPIGYRQAGKATHASIRSVLMSVWQGFNKRPVFPCLATTSLMAARRRVFLGRPASGLACCSRSAIREFSESCFVPRSVFWKWFAGLPSLSTVITVDRVGVVIRPACTIIFACVPTRGPDQSSFVCCRVAA